MSSTDSQSSLIDLFSTIAENHPDCPAFTFLDCNLNASSYTYRQLWKAVKEVAGRITRLGFIKKTPIGILLQSQESQVIHYLAVISAGLVPAILTPPNRKLKPEIFKKTIASLVECCCFSAIISDANALSADVTLLAPETLEILHHSRRQANPIENTAILQFTSGTTGIKRGVQISHGAMLRSMRVYADAIKLGRSDTILSWLPLYHDMGFIACLNMPLAFGVHCIMIHPLDWVANPTLFIQASSLYHATLSWNPNFAYAFMAERVDQEQLIDVDLSSLRGLVNCAEPVTVESQQRFKTRFAGYGLKCNIFRGCYAMAETTFALTDGQETDSSYLDFLGPTESDLLVKLPQISVGRALPDVELAVMDENNRHVSDRELGEIWVRSPLLFSGYYNNPAATSEAMQQNWYKTGDIGYRIGQEYYVCSRKKDLLILNGVNIFPQDVEELVASVEGVIAGRVVAFSEFNEQFQSEVLIVLAESNVPAHEINAVIIRIRQAILAQFQVAGFSVYILPPHWLVKSSSGKIARHTNKAKWLAER
ncbi:MAG: AMP-binding protein [Desulfuromonadaceae bacterium]|nr:AMP-binding protein [Desulfuromonadaceae bacterium]